MSADETLARRADEIVADLERVVKDTAYQGFEAIGKLVDQGEMTWEQVFTIQRNLGAVAVLATYDVNPAIQAGAIRKLEQSIDGAGDE